MIENEQNIIEQARLGEPVAFGHLYDLHHPKIYRYIFLKVSHREEAEDLTHQVFLSAWQNIKSYREKDKVPFTSWLYRIAKNKVIDYYRGRKPIFSLEMVGENIMEDFPSPLLIAEKSIELENVKQAISSLGEEQQDVLIMRFVEDLPLKEVATILNKSVGAIKLIQHRAIINLKKILKENGKTASTA